MLERLKKAELAINQVSLWKPDDVQIIRSLGNGVSNDVWLIEYQQKKYALRIDKPFASALSLDRKNEFTIHQILADEKLAPNIFFMDINKGLLVTHFIQGRTWDTQDFNSKSQLLLLASKLRKLHSLIPNVSNYNLAGGIKKYAEILDQSQSTIWANEALTMLSDLSDYEKVICHNDLHPQNIIESNVNGKTQLSFIDLEYSGLGNPLFDISTIMSQQGTEEITDYFLKAYYGQIDDNLKRELDLQEKINDRLLALWYSVLIKRDPENLESHLLLEKIKTRI